MSLYGRLWIPAFVGMAGALAAMWRGAQTGTQREGARRVRSKGHHGIGIGGRLVTRRTMFTRSQQTIDPLAQFVTVESVQCILSDLQVIAEAAESLPEPAKTRPNDNLVHAASTDPMAAVQMFRAAILVVLSLLWLWVNSSALRGQ